MERANAVCGATTSSLAVPLCTSTQAYTMGGTANYTLPPPPPNVFGFFTHTVRTKANSIKFAHQSMCSPTISTLLKEIRRGYLDGCPNLSAIGVTRYLNPSPATAKGHMKRPHQGIRSTTVHQPHPPPSSRQGPTVHAAPIADDDRLDRRHLRAIDPSRTVQPWPCSPRRGRQQLCRKYFLFCTARVQRSLFSISTPSYEILRGGNGMRR